jgi:hypothetical protein
VFQQFAYDLDVKLIEPDGFIALGNVTAAILRRLAGAIR